MTCVVTLSITPAWVDRCFYPAYATARTRWGDDECSVVGEVLEEVFPQVPVNAPMTGPQYEAQRRVRLAVAILMNRSGVPVRYPDDPRTPRPDGLPMTDPWRRALLTGWAR